MERLTKTEIYNLNAGDRFYKANDKTKVVYEKIEHKPKQTGFQTYSHWAIEATFIDNDLRMSERTIASFARSFKSDTLVIFLRNKYD